MHLLILAEASSLTKQWNEIIILILIPSTISSLDREPLYASHNNLNFSFINIVIEQPTEFALKNKRMDLFV